MEFISIVLLIIGLALGYTIAHFRSKSEQSRLEERNTNLAEQLEQVEQEEKQSEQRASEAEKENVRLKSVNDNLKEKLDEQKEEMAALQERFKDEFENLANKILEEKSKKFTEQNKEKLDQLLKPLGEKMEAFKKKVEETHKEEVEARGSLKNELENLMKLNQQMSEEAKNLTKALKNDSKTQGRWGEVILERILNKSGLTEGEEYVVQESFTTDDGRRLQPDVVVHLSEEKHIIIDSKVSLTAYQRFTSADEDEVKDTALKNHITSLRNHVKNLSEKSYDQLYGVGSPDFVLMFVPIESAFGLALQEDSTLYYEAFDKNVVIVSPTMLLATLSTIESAWKQIKQNKNAQKIADRAELLLRKFATFSESLLKIGERIEQAQKSYDDALGQFKDGRGNLVRQAEMLKELGAKSGKSMPGELSESPQLEDGEEE